MSVRDVPGYFFLTSVWGREYTQLYLDVVLPAQLAKGNLPAFREHPRCKYLIYTTAADAETIRRSCIFPQLRETIPTTIEPIQLQAGSSYERMNQCHRRGIAAADQAGAAIIFLTPDIVWADGSLRMVKRLAEAGRDVVFVTGVRTRKHAVSFYLRTHFKDLSAISIAPRDLMRVALDNLHPIAEQSWWQEGDADLVPANLYWRVGSEGIVARCFHLHPLLVLPQQRHATFFQSVDGDYVMAACPDSSQDYVVTDSDEILAIELSEESRIIPTSLRKGSVKDAASYAEGAANRRHRSLFGSTIRMHTGIHDTELWTEAENDAEAIASAINCRLRRSTWQLLLTADLGLFRRLSRFQKDRQLALANGFSPNPADRFTQHWFAADLRPGPFTNSASSVVKFCRSRQLSLIDAYRRVKTLVFGTKVQPRFWTLSYPYSRQLRNELRAVLKSPSDVLMVSRDLSCSHIHAELSSMGHNVSIAIPIVHGGRCTFISKTSNDPVLPASQDVVAIDHVILGEDTAVRINEACRVLKPAGELLLLMDSVIGADAVAKIVRSGFEVRKQTSIGAVRSTLVHLIWAEKLS